MARSKTTVDQLVLDMTVYPRVEVDSVNVKDLKDALLAGETLPPIIADRQSKRVVDGFHRIHAHRDLYGENAPIDVEWRDYDDDRALYLDAVRLNAGHGRKLTRFDQARISARADELHIEPAEIAAALRLTIARIDEITLKKTAIGTTGKAVPLKGTARHLAQGHLTASQQVGNDRASGMSVRFHVRQVVNAIEHDLADFSDENLLRELAQLSQLIKQRVPFELVSS